MQGKRNASKIKFTSKNNHSMNHNSSFNRLHKANGTELQCWIIKAKTNLQSHAMFIDDDLKQKGCFSHNSGKHSIMSIIDNEISITIRDFF